MWTIAGSNRKFGTQERKIPSHRNRSSDGFEAVRTSQNLEATMGFWELTERLPIDFCWKGMKQDVTRYVWTWPGCQTCKAKYCPRGNEVTIVNHSQEPFRVTHLDFAQLKRKGEGEKTTQAFLVAIDECIRFVAAKPRKENTNSIISLLERNLFKNTKAAIVDNKPAFQSKKLKAWAPAKRIQFRFQAPYHP